LSGRAVLYFAIGLLACLAPFIAVLVRDALHMGLNVPETLRWAIFNSDGNDFRGAFFDFSLRLLPSDLFQWGAYLALQFVGLAGLCGLVGAVAIWRMTERPLAIYMVLLYLGVMVFAFAYRVGDRYVFYLPGYLPFTVWIGFGAQWLMDRVERSHALRMKTGWAQAVLVILVLSVPVALYRIAPELVSRGITFREARHVPGPNSRYYFLWPPKTGYTDTRQYAEETMASLPADAVLYADHVLIAPLIFLQRVEGIRPDVTLEVCCGEGLVADVEGGSERPLAIADVTPGIYPIQWLQKSHDIVPQGSVYLVVRKAR
jgi:hypothetical protein